MTMVPIAFMMPSCRKDSLLKENETDISSLSSADSVKYNPSWTFASHGKAVHDYSIVFPQDSTNRLEIIIPPGNWIKIRENMKALFGYDFGGKAGAPGISPKDEPDYVDVLLKFRGKQWKNVGYRLKGNSSLNQAWGAGNYKLPFRLNFDKFEDSIQAIKNQHFYGFKELTFSCGFKDQSLIREKLASEAFRMGGIPASQTAFYRLYVDFGAGLKYCGVYTAVEIPEDNMVKSQFGEEKGNIYKPTSRLSNFIQAEFEKKNNETASDFSDIQAFIFALNSNLRKDNSAQWKTNLEAVFNVNHFLKYLAVNNAIVNWDSYGVMAHNYYLYNHSLTKLTWIPWDHNESFTGNPGITGTAPGSNQGPRPGLSLSMNEINNMWPLIRYLTDDPDYFQKYKMYLKDFGSNVLGKEAIILLIDKYFDMITPYAVGPNGEQSGYTFLNGPSAFNNSRNDLKTHISNRKILIDSF